MFILIRTLLAQSSYLPDIISQLSQTFLIKEIMYEISKNNLNQMNCPIPSILRNWKQQYACYFYSSNLHNFEPVIQFSSIIKNIDNKLANNIRSMSSNVTVKFNQNENLSMEQEMVPSHMQILTRHFAFTSPLLIWRAKTIAFKQKPGQKECKYIQAFHSQIIDADLHFTWAEKCLALLCISRLQNMHVRRELISIRDLNPLSLNFSAHASQRHFSRFPLPARGYFISNQYYRLRNGLFYGLGNLEKSMPDNLPAFETIDI